MKNYIPTTMSAGGVEVSLDFMVKTKYEGKVLLAGYLDRAKSKVRSIGSSFGSRALIQVGGYEKLSTFGDEYTTIYKPVRMGRDRFVYAFTMNKSIGDRYLVTTKESFKGDFFHFLMMNYHLPLLEEWTSYLLKACMDRGLVKSIQYSYRMTDPDRCIPIHGMQCPLNEIGVLDLFDMSEEGLKKLLSEGLREKKIRISENEQTPLKFNGFDEYIRIYGSSIVKNIEKDLEPLSPLEGKVASLALMHKRLFPQQAACANGIKALRRAGSHYGFMAEGMGCGKTIQGAVVCDSYMNDRWLEAHPGKTLRDLYLADEVKYRNIMMAPSHLVEKWKDEILSEIPGTRVTVIDDFKKLIDLRAGGKERTGRDWYLISKDFCKLGSQMSPIPTNTARQYPSLNFCRDCYEERSMPVPILGVGNKACCVSCGGRRKISRPVKEWGKLYGMVCPSCGKLLLRYSPKLYKGADLEDPSSYVLKPADFSSRKSDNSKCLHCGAPLWGVDVKPVDCGGEYSSLVKNRRSMWRKVSHYKNAAKKGKTIAFVLRGHEQEYYDEHYHAGLADVEREYGPRKSAPALFIRKYLKGYFDFTVLDEAHKYENAGTAQSNAAHALISVSDFTLALTGTLTNGKADSLFYLLYLLDPRKMQKEGYAYTDMLKFVEKYGSIETIYEVDRDSSYNSCSRGRQIQPPRVKPGISPLLVIDFLLEKAVFLDLSDLSKYLPPLKENVILVDPEVDMKEAYNYVLQELKQKAAIAASNGPRRNNMGTMLTFGLSYLDKPYGRKDIMSTTKDNVIDVRVPNLDYYEQELLPKEVKLVELINQEIAEDRNCFVYASYTGEAESNVAYRLKDIIEEKCNLKNQVFVLTASNPAPVKREAFLKQKAKEGYRVIICNPKCVETGLDFCFWFEGKWYNYPTLIFYQISYELAVIWQASRRAYRLIQTEECRNYYLGYAETLQAAALQIMAEKQVAASAVQGKFSVEGLSALAKGVDPRLKLAQMLAAGDNSSRESLENMFDVLNNTNDGDEDDAYEGYEPPLTYYEVMGVEETVNVMEELSLLDIMGDAQAEKPDNQNKTEETKKETEPQEYTELSIFDVFDILSEAPVKSEKPKKPKKKRKTLSSDYEEVTLLSLAM